MVFGETVAVYCVDRTEHTDTLCGQNTVRTSQETRYVLATDPSSFMLFGETVSVYFGTVRNTQIHSEGSPYLTANTLRLRCRDQPVNGVWGNSRC
jgi:hypothetical protein